MHHFLKTRKLQLPFHVCNVSVVQVNWLAHIPVGGTTCLEAATRGVLYEKYILKNFAKFIEKDLCLRVSFAKVADLQECEQES